MKQYIKKALWIIPFVFSLNLSAQYYFTGTIGTSGYGDGWDPQNWTDNSGTPATALSGITINLNNVNVDFAGAELDDVTITNKSGSTSKIKNSGTVYVISTNAPTFSNPFSNITYEFDQGGEFVYTAPASGGSNATISPLDYYDLRISGTTAQLGNSISVKNKLIFDYENTLLTITNGTSTIVTPGLVVAQFMNLNLKSTSSIEILNSNSSQNHFITLTGTITDSRGTKTYSGIFNHNNSGISVVPATYYNLNIQASTSLSGNTIISNNLALSSSKTLSCQSYSLEINTVTLTTTLTSKSRIDCSSGKLIIAKNYNFDKDNFGSNTLRTASKILTNPNKLEVKSGVTVTQTSDILISSELIISATNSYYNLNGFTLTVNGTITNSNGANGGKFKGSTSSSLICGAQGTLYFDQTGTANYLKNFTINNSKTITLGNTLNITGGTSWGTLVVDTLATCSTGNYLILKSDANGTARIGQSSGTITGEYTIEQYLNAERDYRFLASPVDGGTALQWRDNAPTTATSGRGIHITGGSGSDFDNTVTNKPSAFWYDESKAGDVITISTTGSTSADDPGYTAFSSAGSTFTLTNGMGYRVFVRGDRTIDLSASPAPTANATTIWVKGTYPGYSKTIDVYNSNRAKDNNGMNFLGNPYPSAIDWNLLTRSNVDNGYMVYDYANNSFVGWNGSIGDAGQYISSGQGFFVYCNNNSNTNGGTITIHERNKADEVGGAFFQQKIENHLKINLMYDSSYSSNTHIHFRNDASYTRDEWDIPQMANNGTNIASLDSTNYPYYINSLGQIDSFISVPLSIKGTPSAKLKMSFFDLASFHSHKLELVDNYLNVTTPISEGMIYPLEITSDSMSFKNGRFFINFTKAELASNKLIKNTTIAQIAPNPIANNKINITLANKFDQAEYEILDHSGKIIITGKINSNKSIDAKALASGIYFINLTANGTSQTIQFIK